MVHFRAGRLLMSGAIAMLDSASTSLLVGVSPSTAAAGGSSRPFDTPAVTASASGGSGNYTYSWAVLVDGGDVTILTPSLAATAFEFGAPIDGLNSALVRVTAVDTATGASGIKDVPVYFNYFEWNPYA